MLSHFPSLVILILLGVSPVLFSAPTRIGILDFQVSQQLPDTLGKDFALLATQAIDPQKYVIKERLQLSAIQKERLLQPNQVGGLEGFHVDLLMVGEIGKQQQGFWLHARVLDLQGNIHKPQISLQASNLQTLRYQFLHHLVASPIGYQPPGYHYLKIPTLSSLPGPVYAMRGGEKIFLDKVNLLPTGNYSLFIGERLYRQIQLDSEQTVTVVSQPTSALSLEVTWWFWVMIVLLLGLLILLLIRLCKWRWQKRPSPRQVVGQLQQLREHTRQNLTKTGEQQRSLRLQQLLKEIDILLVSLESPLQDKQVFRKIAPEVTQLRNTLDLAFSEQVLSLWERQIQSCQRHVQAFLP